MTNNQLQYETMPKHYLLYLKRETKRITVFTFGEDGAIKTITP